ncbi:histidine kinase [Algoriphagus boseongensis]|uniref:Histidine kinase n=1 Tax=Algoriphagus boseongensis TaxID=1442587 RepID=A0A4R6T3K4_9BACT|nr:histidine kinase [Algoriphagus boseongensis]TDQ16312.1 histidine kinase [Algoriphagus boseongensis]
MLFNAFSNPNLGKWIIPGTGILWFSGCFFLFRFYGLEVEEAFTDAFFFALLFALGIWVLDMVFSLFSPKGRNLWLIFLVPVTLSFLSVFAHRFFMTWWMEDQEEYLEFLHHTTYVRLAFLALSEQMIAFLALVVSKLERQEELNKREAQMLQLSKDAELAQLRQQLQPHFLFNSLNSINALVIKQPQKAREMVLLLSDFLRGTIRKDTKSWISLEEEMNYLKMYLEIERVRFGHRLDVEFSIDERTEKLKIPQLLIQPLVENAIKHGLYGVTGEVKIKIECEKEGNYLLLKVENPFDAQSSSQEGTGFGLNSVERRLYLLFGRKDLLATSSEENVFQVQLKIPQYQ